MNTERTPTTTELPVSLAVVKDHVRVDGGFDDASVVLLIRTAAADVEAQAGIALLTQTITITVEDAGCLVDLAIGPAAADAEAVVETIVADGTATEMVEGFRFETGRYPRLHLDTVPTTALRITFTAGFGDTAADVPADLQMAIADQVARLYDRRGGEVDRGPALSAHTARVIARYRRVRA